MLAVINCTKYSETSKQWTATVDLKFVHCEDLSPDPILLNKELNKKFLNIFHLSSHRRTPSYNGDISVPRRCPSLGGFTVCVGTFFSEISLTHLTQSDGHDLSHRTRKEDYLPLSPILLADSAIFVATLFK